jgi:hypothetical protein
MDEEEQLNECVICLEPVINKHSYFKFNCSHSNYMHNECIIELSNCPLCRIETSEIEIIGITEHNSNFYWIGSFGLPCCVIIFIFFILIIPDNIYSNFNKKNYTYIENFNNSNEAFINPQ